MVPLDDRVDIFPERYHFTDHAGGGDEEQYPGRGERESLTNRLERMSPEPAGCRTAANTCNTVFTASRARVLP